MIGFSLVSLIYLLSRMLDNDEMKGWAQNEFYQVVVSVIILASAVAFLSTINSIVYAILGVLPSGLDFSCNTGGCTYQQLKFNSADIVLGDPTRLAQAVQTTTATCGGEEPCHIAIAVSRMDMLYDTIRHYVANKIASAGTIAILSETTFGFSTFRVAPFAVSKYIINGYSTFINSLNTILLLLKANSMFLVFVSKSLFPMFLIAGLALRSISILRNVGGLMLSLSLGLYFVYPMLIVLSTAIISPNPNSFVLGYDDLTGFLSTPTERPNVTPISTSEIPKIDDTADSGMIDKMLGIVGNVLTLFEDAFFKDIGGHKVDWISYQLFNLIMPNGFIDNVACITVWIFVPMIVSIYGTLIFVKEFSSLLGGDVDIAGLSKLV
jgi:hypothetical protein